MYPISTDIFCKVFAFAVYYIKLEETNTRMHLGHLYGVFMANIFFCYFSLIFPFFSILFFSKKYEFEFCIWSILAKILDENEFGVLFIYKAHTNNINLYNRIRQRVEA